MKISIQCILLLTIYFYSCTASFAGELEITNVRANLSLPSSTGSVWLDIHNSSSEDDTLTTAEVEGCGVTELHTMKMKNGIMMMYQIEDGITIPAGQTVSLKKGGLHIMCINKAAPLQLGTKVDITLYFEKKGEMKALGIVVAPK